MRNVFIGSNGIRAGWRLSIFGALVVVELLVLLGLLKLFHAPIHPPKGNQTQHVPALMIFVADTVFFGALLLAAFIMSKIEKRPMGLYGIPLRQAFGAKFWMGALIGFTGISVVIGMIELAGGGVRFGGLPALTPALAGAFALCLLAFLAAGFFEEFAFRGYVQYTLSTGMYFWPAAILTSAFFAFMHTRNGGETLAGIAQVFLFGIVFCVMLQRTGNLWFGIGYHMAWDWGQTFFYGVPDSGLKSPQNLLHTVIAGHTVWITGGSVGPEGSIFTAVQLLLVLAFVAWRYPKKKCFTTAPAAAVTA